jgi:organic radical activating enzyme
MKLYVLPVEKACNANCGFCITKVREKTGILCEQEYLDVSELEESLKNLEVHKIEITGGGEPTLHPEIERIINLCTDKAKTQMYTNGALACGVRNLERLSNLSISRAHYKNSDNERIMGISYEIGPLIKRVPIKLSLMLCKQGINEASEFSNYLNWASSLGVGKVVVREMFNLDYGNNNNQHVAIVDFFSRLGIKDYALSGRNPIYSQDNLEVEFEFPEMTLHADGKIRRGWRDEI